MIQKKQQRLSRRRRIRAIIRGSAARPRFAVFRSHRGLYVQLIDDQKGQTLAAVSMRGKNIAAAKKLGTEIAEIAAKKSISQVVFDRAGYRYHGGIQALADAAREGGLKF